MTVFTHYRLRVGETTPALLGIYKKGSYQTIYNLIADLAAKSEAKYPVAGTGAVCVKVHMPDFIEWIERTEAK